MSNMNRPKIGAHVSVAGGLKNGILKARAIGAECVQIFGASPQAWAAPGHAPDAIREFQKLREEAGIGPVYLHAAYLVNLASPDLLLRKKSEVNLTEHLKIANQIGADGLIFHIGSGRGLPEGKEAEKIVASAIGRILDSVNGKALLIIENSAGGGEKIGDEPEEIGRIMERAGSPRVKVCWDVQHGFAAGITERYDAAGVSALAERLERSFGLSNLVAFHMNDSKTDFLSRHDRHENIGEGRIGLAGFQTLAGEPRFSEAAWILEVPGFDDRGPDAENVRRLKACFPASEKI